MAWLAVMGVVRCGDNGHYEVFFLYILDERLSFPYDLFMTEKNDSNFVNLISERIGTSDNFAGRYCLWVSKVNVLDSNVPAAKGETWGLIRKSLWEGPEVVCQKQSKQCSPSDAWLGSAAAQPTI